MKIIAKNKIAYRDYNFDKFHEFGIVLIWHEVKSIKMWQVNIKDAIIRIQDRELWIKNMDVPLYNKTNPKLVPDYKQKWDRKLLVNKRELAKISAMIDKPGNVVVPLEVYLNKKWLVKIKAWVWKLMRKVQKKQILKEKDIKRQMEKDIRNY